MNSQRCKERFYQLVYPSHPNEWEVDDVMEDISELQEEQQEMIFNQVSAIWPVSQSLCFTFLEEGARGAKKIPTHLVPDWVRAILRHYETGGLTKARELISDAEGAFLEPLHAQNRVLFETISARMTFFIRGLSGHELDLSRSEISYTDTRTLFLPPALGVFPQYAQNVLLYKLLVSLHWGFVRQGTFSFVPSLEDIVLVKNKYGVGGETVKHPAMVHYISLFPDPLLAADIFFLLETRRVMAWISRELPGLAKQVSLLASEWVGTFASGQLVDITEAVTQFAVSCVFGMCSRDSRFSILLPCENQGDAATGAEIHSLNRIYDRLSQFSGEYQRPSLVDLLGKHDFQQAGIAIDKFRVDTRDAFVAKLANLLEGIQKERVGETATGDNLRADQSLIMLTDVFDDDGAGRKTLSIDNQNFELSEDLLSLISEIENDLGHIPQSYFSAASGIAGKGRSGASSVNPVFEEISENGVMHYDEWDYRRSGYRKNWCKIHEKELTLLRSTFVSATLEKHRGLLVRLRRQFEMMRISEHFVRRQREGNDFDLDAIVEARADHRAGVCPSDRLFIRLHRNERDIATLFLVDMSNSTEGWVGTIIKESLVLLCEAMEVVGDRYGIYGFSGMRRSRCEIFPVKHLKEKYNRVIHQRIGSIMPREYTRLGPAIRYASDLLKQYEARTRLLVTITDGKPEDYDDYKGTYAIEDTRKALQEARGGGLHAFCVTVDRQAHDYLPHMFGAGNYIFVDDIKKLPFRMVDMYRLLTT